MRILELLDKYLETKRQHAETKKELTLVSGDIKIRLEDRFGKLDRELTNVKTDINNMTMSNFMAHELSKWILRHL